jgi:hypothetical protein
MWDHVLCIIGGCAGGDVQNVGTAFASRSQHSQQMCTIQTFTICALSLHVYMSACAQHAGAHLFSIAAPQCAHATLIVSQHTAECGAKVLVKLHNLLMHCAEPVRLAKNAASDNVYVTSPTLSFAWLLCTNRHCAKDFLDDANKSILLTSTFQLATCSSCSD